MRDFLFSCSSGCADACERMDGELAGLAPDERRPDPAWLAVVAAGEVLVFDRALESVPVSWATGSLEKEPFVCNRPLCRPWLVSLAFRSRGCRWVRVGLLRRARAALQIVEGVERTDGRAD